MNALCYTYLLIFANLEIIKVTHHIIQNIFEYNKYFKTV